MAKRLYKLASDQKFIRGRKTSNVVGAILYTVCRKERTTHLLIDFSDVLQTNLFVLGSIYLKLIRVLKIYDIPLIDPSLFLRRFCSKLNFGEKLKQVQQTSLKILQSMSRDWMTTGRRPSGLCGASILISARIHGFKRSIKHIIAVVHCCDQTIRTRLIEFSRTPAAKLTKSQFDDLHFMEGDFSGMNPPAYDRNRRKDAILNKELVNKAKEIETFFKGDTNSVITKETKDTSTINAPPLQPENAFQTMDNNLKLENNFSNVFEQNNSTLTFNHPFQNEKLEVEKEPSETIGFKKSTFSHNIEEPLSDLEDEGNFILSNEEHKLKKMLWEIVFKDWMEEQQYKNESLKKSPVKKRPREHNKIETSISTNPIDAIKKSTKFGKKLNYSFVENLFSKNAYIS
jgi:transcription factor IIIB subunit 2